MPPHRRRHNVDDASERLARELESPKSDTTDPEINALVAAAQNLSPAVYPREPHRIAVKDRMLNAARGISPPRDPRPGAGSKDGLESSGVHGVEVTHPLLGVVTIADVEHIDPKRAEQIVAALAEITEAAEEPR